MNRFTAVIAVIVVSQLAAGEARAEEDVNLRFGAKGTVTGLLWSQPDNTPPLSDGFWGDDQFYYGGGGGLFVEGNAFKYLALEMDLLFEFNSLTFNYTINNIEFDYYTQFDQFRIPIIVKGVLPLGESAEMSLGVGPEFVVGLDSGVEIDRQTDFGNPVANQATDDFLANRYFTETVGGTFFDVDLGITIKVWKLVIPINLRVAINLSQPSDFEERVVNFIPPLGPGTVKAIESMRFAALIGVGYLLPL